MTSQPFDPADLDTLRHTLGIQKKGRRWSAEYRNRFVSGPGHADYDRLERLCAYGYMERVGTINGGEDLIYRCTAKGRKLARV